MGTLFDWSTTAASNTTLDGINVNTGMDVSKTDNTFRSLMALIRNSFSSTLQSFLAGSSALPVASGGTGATSLTGLTLPSATLASATLTTPTVDSAPVETVDGAAPIYFIRAAVVFDGSAGTITPSMTANVSSVTDLGTNTYRVNFTTAMPDTDYCVLISGNGGSNTTGPSNRQFAMVRTRLTTSVTFNFVADDDSSSVEPTYVSVVVVR